ncbi:MAG: hypothetical protein AAFR04_11820 [Pseudomonadota bacterium]
MTNDILAFPSQRNVAPDESVVRVGHAAVDRRIIGLRQLARHLLITPKQDWELACRVIAVDGCATLQAYAGAVLGALDTFGVRQTVFFELPARELSDGERWFAAVFAALDNNDDHSFAALIGFRASQPGRRRLAFLVRGLHEAFAQAECCCATGFATVDELDQVG